MMRSSLPASVNKAAERAAVSLIAAKLSGVASVSDAISATARPENTLVSRAAIATTITVATAIVGQRLNVTTRRFTVELPSSFEDIGPRSGQVKLRVGEDHIAHGLVIFDVAGRSIGPISPIAARIW